MPRLAALLLSVAIPALAAPKALILCYPVDDIIKKACADIQRTLETCEGGAFHVDRLDSPSAESLQLELKARRPRTRADIAEAEKGESKFFPSNMPVFIVGHGGANSDGTHFLALQKFWGPGQPPVTSGDFENSQNTVRSETITKALSEGLTDPAMWKMSCHSGGGCRKGENIGSTCKSWETTTLTAIDLGILKLNLPLDTVTKKILRLLCEPALFASLDKEPNDDLAGAEIQKMYEERMLDNKACFALPVKGDDDVKRGLEAVKRQLGPEGTITKSEVVDDPKRGKQLELEVCQTDCVAADTREKHKFSPVLTDFHLPSPKKQKYVLPPDEAVTPHVTNATQH